MTPVIRTAELRDADAVGAALGEAFDDYSWTRWALDGERRRERLTALYRLEAGIAGAERAGTWLAEVDGQVVAAASWAPPGAPPPSAATAALLDREVPLLLGDRAAALAAAEAAVAPHRPPGEAWVLGCVGTRPAWRGRGLGGALVAAGLAEVDAAGAAAVLETSAPDNVRLYARHGFTVRAEVDPPGGAPRVWVMHRAPRTG
ncbi:GNAT family N-acetyltransferase [Geodermatophilus sp. SYSU D00758]